jgi:hypothetical protein
MRKMKSRTHQTNTEDAQHRAEPQNQARPQGTRPSKKPRIPDSPGPPSRYQDRHQEGSSRQTSRPRHYHSPERRPERSEREQRADSRSERPRSPEPARPNRRRSSRLTN